MTAATARAPGVPAQKDAGQACDDLVAAGLAACAKGGDKQAWDALVERYVPLIWSICRRYRLGRADADDVGQSVWMCLVDQLDKIRDPAALPGWLAATTRRECWRVAGAARGPNAVACAPDAETTPDGQAEAVEHELLAAERHTALREAFTDHTHRQHRPDPQSLPRQDAPLPGHRGADQRGVRLAPAS
jgi:RNA polymerase sigma factor (sigma-70 family)